MQNLKLATVVALVLLTAFAVSAEAQSRSRAPRIRRPYRRPLTSPYLNLLNREGGSFEFEYFRRVRPELEFRREGARLSQSVQDLQRQLNRRRLPERQPGFPGLGSTGHPTSFLNYGGYYNLGRR